MKPQQRPWNSGRELHGDVTATAAARWYGLCLGQRRSGSRRRALNGCRRGRYLLHRYYDPATAQFLSVDPAVAATGSAYGYVDGDPLNSTDPSGLCVGGVFGKHCKGIATTLLRLWLDTLPGAPGETLARTTSGLCISGSIGNGEQGVYVSACIAQSHLHQIGGTFSYGLGPTTKSAGAGVSVQGFVSDAQDLNALGKEFDSGGGTAEPLSGDYSWGTDSCGRPVHVLSGGFGSGYEVHVQRTNTLVGNWLRL